MNAPDFNSGISSRTSANAKNIRWDMRIQALVLGSMDILFMQESAYFCIALVGHMLLLYLINRIHAAYEIILQSDRVIRKTILGIQEFPLQETAFLGIGQDDKHPYRLPAAHYQNNKRIRLSCNNKIICFNPNIFYNTEAAHLFTPEEQQRKNQEYDEAVIAFLQEKCTRSPDEQEKRELIIAWEIRDFLVKMLFVLIILLPIAGAAMLAGLW